MLTLEVKANTPTPLELGAVLRNAGFFFVSANSRINKRFAYDLLRWGAASHPTLQLALGVLDSMLRGFCCDDRWTCGEERG